ncbi:hypothetical protein [Nocardiopsis rhodophaea]|uniref:hypothetical protein n=1 Tax=Nocardiopsis rhodophaea TaxID=280238 RepID=UPI0031E23C3E
MSVWEIDLEGLDLLNANQRLHFHPKAKRTKALRDEACDAARDQGIPPLPRAVVLGYVHPDSNRRYDPPNYYPSFKAAVDGLVDAGVLADDDHTRLSGPHMYPAPKTGRRGVFRLRLVVAADAWRCLCGHDGAEHIGAGGRCVRPGCGCLYHRPAGGAVA